MTATTTKHLPDLLPQHLDMVPIEQAYTAPATWYTTGGFYAFDNEAIFSRQWQYAGHVQQLPNPGDCLLLTVADNPLIVVRGKDNELRAFYNVCRHRAGPLMTSSGHCERGMLQCQYHGWTYTLDGMLRGVPHWNRVDLFDKRDYGLLPVAIDVWQGLIFVHLSPNPRAIGEQLAGISERIAPINVSGLQFEQKIVYPVACNWKAYVDNYLEGYHVPIVHPELNKILDYNQYRTETYDNYSLQYSPFRSDADALMYSNAERAFYYFVFPNIMLNIVGDRLQVNVVVPTGPETCDVHFEYLYRDVASDAARTVIASDIAYSETVQREDEEICAQVQRGLRSKAYHVGRYSVEREEGVHHFHGLLRAAYQQML
jgi:choline monooxygenase